ncbi:MAG TPA: polyhydroxyalkanoate synthesis repressor PhaR [Alphaproteobacteria bacterium]|nr:polyhydroxyalkanoate synthesis repressor PhaR [Alphaproteobacteria bacterium]
MSDAPKQVVTIKKYANRRLYNTATSSYVTLDDLSKMVKEGIEFNVYDAKSSEDITRSVLTQIIVEEEGKTGQNLLPISFLRQLIGFYGDNMQWLVPKYLEHSMQTLAKNQEQIRGYFQSTFGGMFPFGNTLEEMGKQNMAMFERAMRMFSPFNMPGMPGAPSAPQGGSKSSSETRADAQERAEEDAFTPSNITPMPTPNTNQASQSQGGEDVQNKIAALQRQLADMAKK